jgi:hypothetical protein
MTMRPTGLGSGIDKDRADCLHRRVEVGRIYQTRGGPDSLRWFWSLTVGRRTRRGRGMAVTIWFRRQPMHWRDDGATR